MRRTCSGRRAQHRPSRDVEPVTKNVRKNHTSFTDRERERFLDAVFELQITPSAAPPEERRCTVYGDFVATHIDSTWSGPARGTSNFLPWHRRLLVEFEIALNQTSAARSGPRVWLPYWDWTVDREPDRTPWTDEWLGDDGTGMLGQVQRGRFGVPDNDLEHFLSRETMARVRAAGCIRGLAPEEKAAVRQELDHRLAELPEELRNRWFVIRVVDNRPFLNRLFDLPLAPYLPFWERETEEQKRRRRKPEGESFRDRGLGVLDARTRPPTTSSGLGSNWTSTAPCTRSWAATWPAPVRPTTRCSGRTTASWTRSGLTGRSSRPHSTRLPPRTSRCRALKRALVTTSGSLLGTRCQRPT
ncbi:Common central domain of tyrosinase [Lentzea flava]|nr:Common central domain of tyrosinase [Lentzea flava]